MDDSQEGAVKVRCCFSLLPERITDCSGCEEPPSMFSPGAKRKISAYQNEDVMVVIFRQQWFLWKIRLFLRKK